MDRQTGIALTVATLGFMAFSKGVAEIKPDGKRIRDRLSHLDPEVTKEAAKWKTSENAIRSIIWVESRGRVDLPPTYERVVDSYSYGPMQILLSTAQEMGFTGTPEELMKAEANLHFGCKYLTRQLHRYGGDMEKAAAAYNAGGAYKRKGQYVNQSYVNKVMGAYTALQKYDRERVA